MATAYHEIKLDPAFARLLARQEEIQRVFLKGPTPGELDPSRKMAFLMETGTSLMCEVTEALNETGWKPWATEEYINSDAFREELADIFIFLMNFMLTDRMTMMELAQRVEEKQNKNLERQRAGYTGTKEKCPKCKAALDGAGVRCYYVLDQDLYWCDKAKDYFHQGQQVEVV